MNNHANEKITGILTMDNVKYHFEFMDFRLKLIELDRIEEKGIRFNILEIDDNKILCGNIINSRDNIVLFISKQLCGFSDFAILIHVDYYILSSECESLSKIYSVKLKCTDLERLCPSTTSIPDFLSDKARTGELTLNYRSFKETDVELGSVGLCQTNCNVNINTTRGVSFDGKVLIDYYLTFRFENKIDSSSLKKIFTISFKLLKYLFQRKYIQYEEIAIQTKNEEEQYQNIGEAYFPPFSMNYSPIDINGEFMFSSELLGSHLNQLLRKIVDDDIYLEYIIDENLIQKQHCNYLKYLAYTTAFEYEFAKMYPNGIEHSKKHENLVTRIKTELNPIIEKANSDDKRVYKRFVEELDEISLNDKINYVLKKYPIIINKVRNLYNILPNDTNDNIANKLATRLSQNRNKAAHGGINESLLGELRYDLIALKYIVFCMQLVRIGLNQNEIENVFNAMLLKY